MRPFKLDKNSVNDAIKNHPEWNIGPLQVAIYIATGGGMIGRMFAEQPANAYIDLRVGKLPYTRKEIENMRICLVELAKAKNLNPSHLPLMPGFHNCGIF